MTAREAMETALVAIARYLEHNGVPELVEDHFPRRRPVVRRVLRVLAPTAFLTSLILFVQGFDYTPDVHVTDGWVAAAGVAFFVGLWSKMRADELKRPLRCSPYRPWYRQPSRVVELAIWLLLTGVAVAASVGDPVDNLPAVALFTAVLLYRSATRMVVRANLGTMLNAVARSIAHGVAWRPKLGASLPVMLGVVGFLFIGGDTWRIFGPMGPWRFWTLIAVLSVAGGAALWAVVPQKLRPVTMPAGTDVAGSVAGVAEAASLAAAGVAPVTTDLERRTRFALVLPVWLTLFVRLVVASVGLAAVLYVLGMLVVGPDQSRDLAGAGAAARTLTLLGHTAVISTDLLHVAVVLSVLGAASFVVVTLRDPAASLRFEQGEPVERVARILAVAALYRGGVTAMPTRFVLHGVRIVRSDLRDLDLRGADLTAADLSGADLRGAIADDRTAWPPGFGDPRVHGVRVRTARRARHAPTPELEAVIPGVAGAVDGSQESAARLP